MYHTCNQTYFARLLDQLMLESMETKEAPSASLQSENPFEIRSSTEAFGGGGCSWENSLIELLDCNCPVSVQQTTPTNQR